MKKRKKTPRQQQRRSSDEKSPPARVGALGLNGEVQREKSTGPRPRNLLTSKSHAPSVAVNVRQAAQEGKHVVADLHRGASALIDGCVRIYRFMERHGHDKEAVSAFTLPMVDAGQMSRAEARLGASSPKLSKLRAIGQWADVLRQIPFPDASYTIMYQAAVLHEKLEAENRGGEFDRIIADAKGELSREYLANATRIVKRAATARMRLDVVEAESNILTLEQRRDLRGLIAERQRFGVLVLTPFPTYRALIRADYPASDALSRALPLYEVAADNAAVVIAGRAHDYPDIACKLLPLCGFAQSSARLLMLRQPTSLDVTDADVVVVASRGMKIDLPAKGQWLDGATPPNTLTLAAQLFPHANRRLHVFASDVTDGWCSLVGDDGWLELPSVR